GAGLYDGTRRRSGGPSPPAKSGWYDAASFTPRDATTEDPHGERAAEQGRPLRTRRRVRMGEGAPEPLHRRRPRRAADRRGDELLPAAAARDRGEAVESGVRRRTALGREAGGPRRDRGERRREEDRRRAVRAVLGGGPALRAERLRGRHPGALRPQAR